jgi:putative ABC transport system permease protein
MDSLHILLRRFAAVFHSRKLDAALDADLDEELRAHLALAVEDKMQHGMSASKARAAALREFGGLTQTREAYRRQRGLPLFEVLGRDLRFALRQLWKAPGFTVTTVLTLAIGIGANTAVFSMMDAIVFHPIAVPGLDRVVTVAEQQGRGESKRVTLANYESWKRQSQSFEGLSVRSSRSLNLTGSGAPGSTVLDEAAHVEASVTSADFFSVLQIQPALGRVYQSSECQPGHDNVAVLSFPFWKSHFAADPAILGRTIRLGDRAYTVIGVMPKAVQYPASSDLFLPLAVTTEQENDRVGHDYQVLGRLRPGVSLKQAQADLGLIADRLAASYPASNFGWSTRVQPLLDTISGDMTPLFFRLILVATAFVLLVVCANIANLQFVRGLARQPEIAVRIALGAGRANLLRQLLTENLLLGALGMIAGLGLAALGLHICIACMPAEVAREIAGWSSIALNGRALAFSFLLALSAGVASGLLPALRALRVDPIAQLKAGSRTTSGGRQTHRLRDLFAASQVALSVLLVIGAALMCKGMWSMLHMADARQPNKVLTVTVDLPPGRYANDARLAAWYASSLDRLRDLPGVTHAEVATALPDGEGGWTDDIRIENRPAQPGKFQSATHLAVSGGYFDALHIALVAGRSFSSADTLDAQPVAVVSRKFVERYLHGENPIGRRIQMGQANGMGQANSGSQSPNQSQDRQPAHTWLRIVGVVEDVSYLWVDRNIGPAVYLNAAQMPPSSATYLVVTEGNPLALAPAARRALAGLDATVPLEEVQTYRRYLDNSLAGLMYVASILSFDAAVGLLLAAIGIFAVMANLVAERHREIGVRIAMGAQPRDMLRMILRRAGLLSGIGVAIGAVLAAGLANLSANLLFGVQPNDPAIFFSITSGILAITLLVSWGPARRASRIDPIRALRNE